MKRAIQRPLVIGIDPATGLKSDVGLAMFDPYTGRITDACKIGSKKTELHQRLKEIAVHTKECIEAGVAEANASSLTIGMEYFVMKGKGGESLARAVGALYTALPDKTKLISVQNTTVKLKLAGHGHADKLAVAMGVKSFFSERNVESGNFILDLIANREFDILDAFAIGITAWQNQS